MTDRAATDREEIQRRATDCREALFETSRAIRALEARAIRALEDASIRTAEQRARAERAEEALRAAGQRPGEPVEWRGHGMTARVVSDAHRTDLRVLAGLEGVAVQAFSALGEAGTTAIVTLQARPAPLGERDARVQLWLSLAPGGSLDQLYAALGAQIHARDAKNAAAKAERDGVQNHAGNVCAREGCDHTTSRGLQFCACCLMFDPEPRVCAIAGSAR